MQCPRCMSPNIDADRDVTIHAANPGRCWLLPLMQILIRNYLWAHYEKYGAKCTCLDCGFEWFENCTALERKYIEHLSVLLGCRDAKSYTAEDGTTLCIAVTGVSIRRNVWRNCVIPYDRIAAVDIAADREAGLGWLSIRHKRNRYKPFPKTLAEARKHRATVCYSLHDAATYCKIYSALNAIAEENKRANIF